MFRDFSGGCFHVSLLDDLQLVLITKWLLHQHTLSNPRTSKWATFCVFLENSLTTKPYKTHKSLGECYVRAGLVEQPIKRSTTMIDLSTHDDILCFCHVCQESTLPEITKSARDKNGDTHFTKQNLCNNVGDPSPPQTALQGSATFQVPIK